MTSTDQGFGGNDFGDILSQSVSRGNVKGVNQGYDQTGTAADSPPLSPTQDGGSIDRMAANQAKAKFTPQNPVAAASLANDLGDIYSAAIARGNVKGVNQGYDSSGATSATPPLGPTQDGGHEDRISLQ